MTENAEAKGFSPDSLVLSAGYADTMDRIVLPYLSAHRTDTRFDRGGCALFTSRFEPDGASRGTVMIVHGFTENIDKYAEIIYSLLKNGFSVLGYDQRGHGRSGRPGGSADLSLTHVDRFDDYVDDMAALIEQLLAPMPRPRSLFCHSMGGGVSALYLEKDPDAFQRAVFSSPMIAPNLRNVPAGLVRFICRVPILFGNGSKRAFISHPYSGPGAFETSCASGRERFDWYEALREATPEFHNNGPTYTWALEAAGVTKRILAPGMPERITMPVRVYCAGEDDSVVPAREEAFARRLPHAVFKKVPGSRHEIIRSPDSVLFPWWHEVLTFLEGEDG